MSSTAITKFHDRDVKPPRGGWHYTVHGERVEASSESGIIDLVERYQRNNGMFVGRVAIEREVWAYYCRREPNRCRSAAHRVEPQARTSLVQSFARLVLGLVRAKAAGRSVFVGQDEAERRAAICAECPLQCNRSDCPECRALIRALSARMAGRSTSQDGRLRTCCVCGCELKAAVHIDLEAQQAAVTPEMDNQFPSHCWKKRSS